MLSLYVLAVVVCTQARSQLLPGSCSFESNTCGYTSDANSRSWTLHRDGRFVAVDLEDDTSSKAAPEILGILLSPPLDHSDWSCLRLVYQITGSGSLEVLQRFTRKSFDRPLWSSHTPSDSWVISSMDLHNHTESSMVVLEGRPGASAGSSVAVFEIHISPGYCLECDFEESHLCGYSNQWNANVNWFVGGGSQLLHNDIPNDHTYNNKTGHLMYVDSVYAKTFKEVAKLVSPLTTIPMSGCLSFNYQRSEEGGNLFSVFMRDRLGQYQELWRPENHSESAGEWTPVQVDLKAPYSIQVVFEAAFNSPRSGRVALDDISFSPEFCSKDTEPTFDPSIANCDFESGLCRYTQGQLTGPSWRRVSVKPNIFRNGDHTTGAGSFLLTHSRLGLQPGYVSRLISPTLPGNMKYCLRFHFSLRGFNQTTQALTVYLQNQQSGALERIWTQGEKSRGIWIAAEATFHTSQPAQVVFISSCRGFWDCGSVALDDISVSLGDCELVSDNEKEFGRGRISVPPVESEDDEPAIPTSPIKRLKLGPGVSIDKKKWQQVQEAKSHSRFCKSLAVAIWGTEVLMERSVTGAKSNAAKHCSVPKPPLTPEKLKIIRGVFSSAPGHCDFEAGLCGYTQDKESDAADWERRRGPTPTSYTGPRGDHSKGLGYYLYLEASPLLPGQNARLMSRPFRGTRGPQCLSFFYHMYGSGTGQLNVHVDKGGDNVLLWQRSGEQSVAWLRAQVEYQCDSQHQIVFEAVRGSSVRSDISLDDVLLENGPCPEMEIQTSVGNSNDIE